MLESAKRGGTGWFRKFNRAVILIQRIICYVTAIAIPLLIVFQVILRYVLHAPLMGIEELLKFPMIWLYMMGGSVASEQRNHIECGILTLYIKKEFSKKLFLCVKSILSVAVASWLAYWAGWYFSYSLHLWKTSDILHIPMFFAESALFIGLLFMIYFGILELVEHVLDLFGHKKEESAV